MIKSVIPKKQAQPQWSSPMLATLTNNHFSDPSWIFETKLDGMRCILCKKGKIINIYSRNRKIQNDVFPELVKALARLKFDFILDCEVVTFVGKISNFEKLQLRMHVQNPSKELIKKVPVFAYIFDVMHFNGYNLCALPLMQRKQILLQNFKFKDPLRHLEYKIEYGEKYLKKACTIGEEGIIAKHAFSTYEHKRSRNWLKFKCTLSQELIICGYTKPKGNRQFFGALLLGYYKEGKLIYAGKVGTGFNQAILKELYAKLNKNMINKSPYADYQTNNAIWVRPKLLAEVSFTEWTKDGSLRHPSFKGWREDKDPKRVTRD